MNKFLMLFVNLQVFFITNLYPHSTGLNFDFNYPVNYSSSDIYRKLGMNVGINRATNFNKWILNYNLSLMAYVAEINTSVNYQVKAEEIDGRLIDITINSNTSATYTYLANSYYPYKKETKNVHTIGIEKQYFFDINIPISFGRSFYKDKLTLLSGISFSYEFFKIPILFKGYNKTIGTFKNIPVKQQYFYTNFSALYQTSENIWLNVEYQTPIISNSYGLIKTGVLFRIK